MVTAVGNGVDELSECFTEPIVQSCTKNTGMRHNKLLVSSYHKLQIDQSHQFYLKGYIHTFYFLFFQIKNTTCPWIAYASLGGSC